MAPHQVEVRSAILIEAPASDVWAALCDAPMPTTAPCEFRFGALSPPTPLRCELPDGHGGVGARRRCVSDRGVVEQRITEWTAPTRLSFELVSETAGLGRHVASMRDEFQLVEARGGGTTLSRHTFLTPVGPFSRLRGWFLQLAVHRVHRFTMRGFRDVVRAARVASSPSGDASPCTEQGLRATAAAWDDAMVTNDADAIGHYMATDWQIIGADGGVTDRAAFLAQIRDGRLSHDTMTTEDATVRLHGTVGILVAHGVSAGRFAGRSFRVVERQSNVFVHEAGSWRCVLTHLSAMPDPPTGAA